MGPVVAGLLLPRINTPCGLGFVSVLTPIATDLLTLIIEITDTNN
jgi:hypothetical protein